MSNALVNGLAGAGGGIIAQIISYPLQTVNTRQQTERVAKTKRGGRSPPVAGGTLVQIFKVVRGEGWGGLYSGLKPSLLGTAASQGIYYYFYQVFKNKAEAIAIAHRNNGRGDGTVGMFSWLVVAAIAGSFNVLLTNPIWVLVTRMQTHTQAERKVVEAKREALLMEASEINFIGSTLQDKLAQLDSTKPSPYGTLHAGIYYYFYQVFKNKAEAIAIAHRNNGRGDGTVGMFSWLVVAAIAGSFNVLLTNPIWVLVTRMQTHTQAERKVIEAKREALLMEASESNFIGSTLQDKLAQLDSTKPSPYGTLHAAREVYNEAGITGFWKGIIPTLIMVCNPSIQFMIYESSLKHLRAKRSSNKQGINNVTALEVFLLGALAKLGATMSTYPLLVVKVRSLLVCFMMMQFLTCLAEDNLSVSLFDGLSTHFPVWTWWTGKKWVAEEDEKYRGEHESFMCCPLI
ncbi:hypothetical protein TEA_026334 [Camellia sinensis var. sinensis]|uniref:Peroxisomal nicotinamide adenine dinucleotide carrier n=1 Tax=Camellia sinensis var. sinensis TaxID=542762 RepID=A0A4S4EBL4_CAMSN|nr:hypothetical protein TEA_026334 [Camellia sinensis var. sinensis]